MVWIRRAVASALTDQRAAAASEHFCNDFGVWSISATPKSFFSF
jgi:hypothetical protein